jgi:hypothetical protein
MNPIKMFDTQHKHPDHGLATDPDRDSATRPLVGSALACAAAAVPSDDAPWQASSVAWSVVAALGVCIAGVLGTVASPVGGGVGMLVSLPVSGVGSVGEAYDSGLAGSASPAASSSSSSLSTSMVGTTSRRRALPCPSKLLYRREQWCIDVLSPTAPGIVGPEREPEKVRRLEVKACGRKFLPLLDRDVGGFLVPEPQHPAAVERVAKGDVHRDSNGGGGLLLSRVLDEGNDVACFAEEGRVASSLAFLVGDVTLEVVEETHGHGSKMRNGQAIDLISVERGHEYAVLLEPTASDSVSVYMERKIAASYTGRSNANMGHPESCEQCTV